MSAEHGTRRTVSFLVEVPVVRYDNPRTASGWDPEETFLTLGRRVAAAAELKAESDWKDDDGDVGERRRAQADGVVLVDDLRAVETSYEVPAMSLSEVLLDLAALEADQHQPTEVYYSQQFGPVCPACGSAAIRTACSFWECDDCNGYGHGDVIEGHL